jgi:hypothetical protein
MLLSQISTKTDLVDKLEKEKTEVMEDLNDAR